MSEFERSRGTGVGDRPTEVTSPAPDWRREPPGATREHRSEVEFEHERIGLHNEAETIRRDRVRWGPIWAGIITTVGSYLFLMLGLVTTGLVDLGDMSTGDALATAGAAVIAFFVGGMTTGATAMWQGADDGVLHGIIMWFAALVFLLALSAVGSGLALGAFDTSDAFEGITADDIASDDANDTARDAAGRALIGLTVALAAAAAGGAAGAKMWPRDDVYVDVVRPKRH